MIQSNWDEANKWISELWTDGNFTVPDFNEHNLLGAYTEYCFLVERRGETYLLKRYKIGPPWGVKPELATYSEFAAHPIVPRLITTLSLEAKRMKWLPEGILIPYFEKKLKSPSLIEIVAVFLNLASIFQCFAETNRIYFDLKEDSLRLNANGALQLIDFTDLITPAQLLDRAANRAGGLPVADQESRMLPPEAKRYQKAYEGYKQEKVNWKAVSAAANKLQADAFHSFTLASFTVQLLGGKKLGDKIVRQVFARSASSSEGAFSAAEQSEFRQLLKQMRHRSIGPRVSLSEARQRAWQLLEPRLTASENSRKPVSKARWLISTLPNPAGDVLANKIHSRMQAFWRNSHDI